MEIVNKLDQDQTLTNSMSSAPRAKKLRRVGLVTTIPVEVLFAAGATPVDLNNIFVTDPDPCRFVDRAEVDGFPRNTCSWVKGIYAVALENDIDLIVAVMRGDCSNNEAMAEVLRLKGVEIVPFSYPYPKDYGLLKAEIERLMVRFGTDWDAVSSIRHRLDEVRSLVHRLDDLTWRTGVVTGFENHIWSVSTSDFNTDHVTFESDVRALLAKKQRQLAEKPAEGHAVRLGFVGVPPIFTDLYPYLDSLGTRVVFNEVQRQFSMPVLPGREDRDLVELYLDYTYPYDYFDRIADIEREVERRGIDALIHYVQSFCHHQIHDIVLRQQLSLPILTLEGDKPGPLDARSKMRLEAFVDMCQQKKAVVVR